MASPSLPPTIDRLALIESARNSVFVEKAFASTSLDPIIERSWRRCLGLGYRPEEHVSFAAVSKVATVEALEINRPLLQAANPIMAQMAHAMAMTRYFAILTDARGVVIDTKTVRVPRAPSLSVTVTVTVAL